MDPRIFGVHLFFRSVERSTWVSRCFINSRGIGSRGAEKATFSIAWRGLERAFNVAFPLHYITLRATRSFQLAGNFKSS